MLLDVHPLIEVSIWVGFTFGGLLCLMNFSLPVRYYYRRWKMLPEGRNVSPIPILGSLFVFLTLRILEVIPVVKVVGWILIAIDVGGIHWMIFGMIIYAFRTLLKRPPELESDSKWTSINPVVVVIFILLALVWLVKAFV